MAKDIWPIENGRSTVGAAIRELAPKADAIDAASAFITSRGLDAILPALRKASRRGVVRVVTGVKDCFTEPAALRRLLATCQERGDTFRVRVSRDPHFHWKAYFITAKRTATAIIGSSNLTADGLGASGELNVALSISPDSRTYRDLHRPFDKEWRRATTLTAEWIKKYETVWRRHRPRLPALSSGEIRTLLGLGETRREHLPEPRQERFGAVYCTGFFSKTTEQVLEEATNWDDHRWTVLAVWSRVEIGHKVIVFDFIDRRVFLADVRDTETTRRTPDGRHFAALSPIKGTSKRHMTPLLWKRLKEAGAVRRQTDARSNRFIRRTTWDQLAKLFNRDSA